MVDYNEQYWRNMGGEGESPWTEARKNQYWRNRDFNDPSPEPDGNRVDDTFKAYQELAKEAAAESALDTQVGGGHYKDYEIQPIEYVQKNELGFIEGSIVKYITRYEDKGGANDLDKIIHYCELLKELKYGK